MSSDSEDEVYDSEQSDHEEDHLGKPPSLNQAMEQHLSKDNADQGDKIRSCAQSEGSISIIKTWKTNESTKAETNNILSGFHNTEFASLVNQIGDWFDKRKSRKKPRKRVVSLVEGDDNVTHGETSQGRDVCICGSGEDECHRCFSGHRRESYSGAALVRDGNNRFCGVGQTVGGGDDLVEDYFRMEVSDSGTHENCRLYMHCDCILEQGSVYKEREVVLLLSSEDKLYVLLVGISADSSENSLSLLRSHEVGDIQDVSVGLGLQVVRLRIVEDVEYIFITKSIERTTKLFNIIQIFDSQATESKSLLGSMEQVQLEFFEKDICGGLKLCIFLYNVLLFQSSTLGEETWLQRSLFVTGGHLFICIEDFIQLSTMSPEASSAPYFSLDSRCSISDICEMVIEVEENPCLILRIERMRSEMGPSVGAKFRRNRRVVGSMTWKLKWFNRENLLKFVDLLKALHPDTTERPLLIRHSGPC